MRRWCVGSGGERIYIRKRAGLDARDQNIRRQFDHLLYAGVSSAHAIGMLCARYGLSERSLRRILKRGTVPAA